MRLFPLEPTSRTAANLRRLERDLGLRIIGEDDVDKIVIIGNGTPDDIVIALLGHARNGKNVLGILKPTYTGTAAVRAVKGIIRTFPKVSKFLLLLDQESNSLESIEERLDREIRESALTVISKEKRGARLIHYSCKLASSGFSLIVSINGLDASPYNMHMIEDHLLEAARMLLGHNEVERLTRGSSDPKDAWKRLHQKYIDVYRHIVNMPKDELEQLFPQQMRGLRELMDPF
ncbi:MAG: hypothetical protein DRO00_09735 [Thermoproteota archaeon]|nr:MAG: hypothetical protein DRO00_09735 [Candidatus Korarchaeota archaeon]